MNHLKGIGPVPVMMREGCLLKSIWPRSSHCVVVLDSALFERHAESREALNFYPGDDRGVGVRK